MRNIITFFAAICCFIGAYAANGTKNDPILLFDGQVKVDFGTKNTIYYKYSTSTDKMLTISNMLNVSIYGADISPFGQFYNESMNGVTYVQIRGGVDYLIAANRLVSGVSGSFTLGSYPSAWPDGASWDTAVEASDRICYVPVTLDLPSYVTYTPSEDGVLAVTFNSSVALSVGTSSEGPFESVYLDYKSELQGFRGYVPNVKAGQKLYFYFTGQSALCSMQVIHPVTGESVDFPYDVEVGGKAVVPAGVGTYYYRIATGGRTGCLTVTGDEPLAGTASLGVSFSNLTVSSSGNVGLRMPASQYADYYYMTVRRTSAGAEQKLNVDMSSQAYDLFPGQSIAEGTYSTGELAGTYFYTFTVPTDGHKVVRINTGGSSDVKAELYYADNQYSVLARGSVIEYEAVAGRAYTVAVTVANNSAAPAHFELSFAVPATGASQDTAIEAVAGDNYSEGFANGAMVYFRYTATVDGWLVVTPAAGLKQPLVSMLPIPSDPWMQACDVIAVGDGSYRVAAQKDRGYLVMFQGAKNGIQFKLSEITALPGESASTPLPVTDGVAAVPDGAAIYWFEYTSPRTGKLVVSTNLPYQVTSNHQDYTYVQLYDPSDPNNRIAELRPDIETGQLVDKVLDTTAGTRYLVKVRKLETSTGTTVTFAVRDAVAGETPELPIEIPFAGEYATYTFDRPVNNDADALWYAINLPKGALSMACQTSGRFDANFYLPTDLTTPLVSTSVIGVDYDDNEEMYIYIWGIDGYMLPQAGRYLMHLVDCEEVVTAGIAVNTSGIGAAEADMVCVKPDGNGVAVSGYDGIVNVYGVDGRLVASAEIEGEGHISLAPGFYLIHVGKVVKVKI